MECEFGAERAGGKGQDPGGRDTFVCCFADGKKKRAREEESRVCLKKVSKNTEKYRVSIIPRIYHIT